MIITDAFPGDTNVALKHLQYDLYDQLLLELVRLSRQRYLRAAHLVGVQNELTAALETLKDFDHRVLEATHDTIAAYYRFAHDRRGQMPLPIQDIPYLEWLEQNWRAFYAAEVAHFTEKDDFVRAVLTAIIPRDIFECRGAQKDLAEILAGYYDFTDVPTWLANP